MKYFLLFLGLLFLDLVLLGFMLWFKPTREYVIQAFLSEVGFERKKCTTEAPSLKDAGQKNGMKQKQKPTERPTFKSQASAESIHITARFVGSGT